MLIASARLPLSGHALTLPVWLRAPLYLSNGAKYFGTMQYSKPNLGMLELIVSPFDFDRWDNLWRVEVATEDFPGNSLILVSLLENRGFDILAMESSATGFSKYHAIDLVVSAASYPNDMMHEGQAELRQDIIVYLGDQITFNPDKTPAVKIRQMRVYRRLYDELRTQKRFKLNSNGDYVSEGHISLTDIALDNLLQAFGDTEIAYAAAADTKDRLVSVLFFGKRKYISSYLQIIVSSDYKGGLTSIYRHLYEREVNIVRNCVRPCPPALAKNALRKLDIQIPHIDAKSYRTLDLTIEFKSVDSNEVSESFANIVSEFKRMESETQGQLIVLRPIWNGELG